MIRPRVLAIAEVANPEWVSVPLVGWSLAIALREVAEVHIVTQVRNRDAFLRAGLVEGHDFTAIDSETLARPLWALGQKLRMGEGKGWTTLQMLNALSYPWFEHLVWRHFGRAIRAGEYDIVHRITPLSPTISSSIASKCARAGVPFILGPLNGGVPWPKGFDAERRSEREYLSYVRSAYKALPGRRATLRHASAILGGSRHTLSEIPKAFADKCVYIPENAIDPGRFSMVASPVQNGPLRAGFVGRLVPYKCPDILIEAAAPLLRASRLHLDIVGDGPMMADLKAQADRLGVARAISFHGWLAHENVQTVLAGCHLFAFPSIREFGGGVVLEAMALGVPPLVVDYAGPGELVQAGRGFKVPLSPREILVQEFASALADLVEQPQTLREAGKAARAWVLNKATWSRKADQVSRIYGAVLANEYPLPQVFDCSSLEVTDALISAH